MHVCIVLVFVFVVFFFFFFFFFCGLLESECANAPEVGPRASLCIALFGSVSEKMSLRYIYKKVIKIIHV